MDARMRMYHPRWAGRWIVHSIVDVAFSFLGRQSTLNLLYTLGVIHSRLTTMCSMISSSPRNLSFNVMLR